MTPTAGLRAKLNTVVVQYYEALSGLALAPELTAEGTPARYAE